MCIYNVKSAKMLGSSINWIIDKLVKHCFLLKTLKWKQGEQQEYEWGSCRWWRLIKSIWADLINLSRSDQIWSIWAYPIKTDQINVINVSRTNQCDQCELKLRNYSKADKQPKSSLSPVSHSTWQSQQKEWNLLFF